MDDIAAQDFSAFACFHFAIDQNQAIGDSRLGLAAAAHQAFNLDNLLELNRLAGYDYITHIFPSSPRIGESGSQALVYSTTDQGFANGGDNLMGCACMGDSAERACWAML